ncbi:MAG TPA: SMP-30/gluconolactonase/LRE family protein, partial [Polyangia bacterium]
DGGGQGGASEGGRGASASGGAGGRGGATAGGSGGGTAASFCPGGTYPAVALTGLTAARITAVPPHDDFNLNGTAPLTIIEGPVWTGDALYVSELDYLTQSEALHGTKPPPSRILKVTPAGDVTIAATDTGTNGLALDGAGGLLACDHKNGALTRFTLPDLMPSAVVSGYMNARFDSPNDLVVAPDGNVYFSDPDYQAPQMRPQTATRFYRLAPGATEPTVIDEGRRQPNGVTLSPRGDYLYLNSQDGIYRYPISAGGAVGAGAKFSQAVASGDGVAIDCAGNLYIASGQAIVVLDPSGAQLGQIMVSGVQSVTNAAFGGSDRKTLYITALGMGSSAGLFKVSLNVPGYPY